MRRTLFELSWSSVCLCAAPVDVLAFLDGFVFGCGTFGWRNVVVVDGAVFGVGGTMSIKCFRVRAGLVAGAPMWSEDPSTDWLDGGRTTGVAGAGVMGGACLLR